MKKRILSVTLCIVLITGCCLSSYNKVPVKAAATTAVSAATAYEIVMAILAAVGTVAVTAGAADVLTDYDASKSLWETLVDGWSMDDIMITLEDGTQIRSADLINMMTTDGSSALAFPDSDTWMQYGLINGGGNSGGEDPEEPEEPKNPFSKVKQLIIGTGFLEEAGRFFKSLYQGETELDAHVYYPIGYTGVPRKDANGNNLYDITFSDLSYSNYVRTKTDYATSYFLTGIVSTNNNWNPPRLQLMLYQYKYSDGHYYTRGQIDLWGSQNYASWYVRDNTLVTDIPMFSSSAAMDAYLDSGDCSGLLNGECYDFPDLAESVPEILAPLTNTPLAPGDIPALNGALVDAANALEPSTDLAKRAENTQERKDTLVSTIAQFNPSIEPEPEPDPEPEPEPEPDPGTGEGMDDYKVNLTDLFPFCIPFDFVRFLQALSAAPEAPKFDIPIKLDILGIDEVVTIDLSWMDDVMKVFRLGELGCFVLLLMVNTRKMIKW